MGIYISGIDMPTKGNPITVLIYPDGTAEWMARNKTGIAMPVPPHGRLIDADAIEYTYATVRDKHDGHNWRVFAVGLDEIDEMPTIIPKEVKIK